MPWTLVAEGPEQIPKPIDDKRSYRLIRLDNGLEALLIHDPEMARQSQEAEEDEEMEGEEEDDEEMAGEEEEDEEMEGEEEDEAEVGGEESKKAAASLAVGIGSFSDGPIGNYSFISPMN